jgi:hypothetical protein
MTRPILAALLLVPAMEAQDAPPKDASPPIAATVDARRRLEVDVPPPLVAEQVRWFGNWERAVAEAKRRNVPIVAMLCDDTSAGFATVRTNVYSRPEFAAFSRKCVLVAAFDGKSHGSKPRKVDGADVAWCDLFGVPCEEHRRSFAHVLEVYCTREYWMPLHVFVAPGGEEIGRVESHKATQAQLDEELALARKQVGPSLPYEDYCALLAKLRDVVGQRDKRGRASVHAELGRMIAADRKAEESGGKRPLFGAALRELVEGLQQALLDEGAGMVADAEALAAGGQVEEARRALRQVKEAFKGLPPAQAAEQALARLPAAK